MAISNSLIAYLAEESAFEFAAQNVLQVEGIIPDVRLRGDPRALPDEVCSVGFRKQRPDGTRGVRPTLAGSRQEYSIFSGILEVKYGILRTTNVASSIVGCVTKLDEKIGIIRACFLRSSHFFIAGRLRNAVVNDITEEDPTYGVDATANKERDFVILPFRVTYERIMANFPAA